MNLLRLLGVGMIVCVVQTAVAQTYPTDREKFVKVYQKSLADYSTGGETSFFKKEFTPMLVESNQISDEHFTWIVSSFNTMETKRLKVFPEMYNTL